MKRGRRTRPLVRYTFNFRESSRTFDKLFVPCGEGWHILDGTHDNERHFMTEHRIKLTLTAQIGLALVLGLAVGLLLQNNVELANSYIKPFGTIFLNLLKFIVVPLVLLSIITGIISMKDISALGRLGLRTIAYFMATTVVAVTLGLLVSTLLRNVFPVISLPAGTSSGQYGKVSFMDQIINMFPGNMIEPLRNANMMQVIIIALLTGFAITKVGNKAEPLAKLIVSANEVVSAILSFIMKLAPVGVFCLLCPVVAENGIHIIGTYAALIGMAYLCFLLHAILVYSSCVRGIGKVSPRRFFKEMFPAMMFAFSSDSSLATLPVTTECTRKLGVRESISNFVLPLGATINMDGVAIYLGVTSVFIAHCCGIDLTLNQYLTIAFASTIASIGTPGVPGGSLALMAMVFASAGLPIEGVAIAAGIDRIIDMGRTMMSVTGDASCAVIMERFERKADAY